MSSTKTRRRPRTGGPASSVPPTVPRPVAPRAAPALFDQAAPETVPPRAETPPAPAETPPRAPTRVDRAAEAAALADVEGDAAFRARKRELALAALDDKAALATAQRLRDAELAAALTAADVAEIGENAAARKWQARGKRWRQRAVTSSLRVRRLAVNLGVTGAAVYGQWQYLDAKTKIGTEGAFAVSVLVELLAVSVLDYAHRRRKARRSSWHLYLAAASMAGGVGAMNFLHWQAAALELVGALFFLFSIAGPLLWSLSAIEAEVSDDDQVPAAPRSARFPAEQWALFLPSTFQAKRLSVRHGITDPGAALDLYSERKAARAASRAAARGRRGKAAQAVEEAPPVDAPPVEAPAPPVYALEGVPSADQLATMTAREVQAAARATARKAIAADARPTGKELGEAYGLSDRWGRERLIEVDKITTAA